MFADKPSKEDLVPDYVNLSPDDIRDEHICCALADKKHQAGVADKKQWLAERIPEGHVFRKLQAKGKVFIEYAPLESAWTPVVGDNYLYIYCLWVSGSFKGKGHAHNLLRYCLENAVSLKKSGVCILSSPRKKPFLSDRRFMEKYGFAPVDAHEGHELLALSFDGGTPRFADSVKKNDAKENGLAIYFGRQCPYISNCVAQIQTYCAATDTPVRFIAVDTLEKAKNLPCPFNNWAVRRQGKLATLSLLNAKGIKEMLETEQA